MYVLNDANSMVENALFLHWYWYLYNWQDYCKYYIGWDVCGASEIKRDKKKEIQDERIDSNGC